MAVSLLVTSAGRCPLDAVSVGRLPAEVEASNEHGRLTRPDSGRDLALVAKPSRVGGH
jgi:hypothetical protein